MVERLQLLDALAVGAVGCGEQPVPPLELGHVDVVHVGRVVRQPLDGALAPHRRRALRLQLLLLVLVERTLSSYISIYLPISPHISEPAAPAPGACSARAAP